MAKRSDAERALWRQRMSAFSKQAASLNAAEREEIARKRPIVTCEGHPLSMYNHALLWMQTGGRFPFTVVAGFRPWAKAGRHVRKGEHAVGYILVPIFTGQKPDAGSAGNMLRIVTDNEAAPAGETKHFRWVPIFDVTQTDEGAAEVRGQKIYADTVEAASPMVPLFT